MLQGVGLSPHTPLKITVTVLSYIIETWHFGCWTNGLSMAYILIPQVLQGTVCSWRYGVHTPIVTQNKREKCQERSQENLLPPEFLKYLLFHCPQYLNQSELKWILLHLLRHHVPFQRCAQQQYRKPYWLLFYSGFLLVVTFFCAHLAKLELCSPESPSSNGSWLGLATWYFCMSFGRKK